MSSPTVMQDQPGDMARRTKAIIGGSIGNLVEWFDWYVYAAFSVYFAKMFFPSGDQTTQLLNVALVFALGFLMRPLGGWLLGRYADSHGRKAGLTISVLMMSFGSLMIGLCPGYEDIGIAAPIILGLARLLQGLSVGGEYGASSAYLSEMATPKRRGFYSSFQYVTLIGGQLLALGVQILLQQILTDEQMHAWGWRIPFLIGAALAVVAFIIRQKLDETKSFKSIAAEKKRNYWSELISHPKAIFLVIGLTLGGGVAFYAYTVYMQKFLINTSGFSKEVAANISAISLIFFCILQPIMGMLSDRIGRRPVLMFFGIGGVLFTIPVFNMLATTTDVYTAFALVMFLLVILSGYTSINAIVKAELFPAHIRALGVALPYAITNSIFSGTVEAVALKLKSVGHESWFYVYVTICIGFSLLVYTFMTDTKKTSLIKDE